MLQKDIKNARENYQKVQRENAILKGEFFALKTQKEKEIRVSW